MASVEEVCDHIALINKSKKILEGNMKQIKMDNRTNTYRFALRNLSQQPKELLPADISLLSEEVEDDSTSFTVQLPLNGNPNELTSMLMNHGELTMMEEVLPTMNEIFIRKVTEMNQ
jgi:ABC-2 type transport system ATP-binding protein